MDWSLYAYGEVDEQAMNRIEFHILPRHQTGKEHKQLIRRHKVKQYKWTKKDSSFPADGHLKGQRQTESGRTLTTRIIYNRSVVLERSVINYWEGLNRFNVATNFSLYSVVVYKKYKLSSPHEEPLTHQCIKTANIHLTKFSATVSKFKYFNRDISYQAHTSHVSVCGYVVSIYYTRNFKFGSHDQL